jgi:Uncharacterized conserved protein
MDSLPEKKPARGLWSRLKRYFLAGVVVTAPAFITVYIAVALVHASDRWAKSLLPGRFPDMRLFGIPGMGLLFMLALFIVIGFIATNWLGKKLSGLTDTLFARMPVLSSLYSTLKQLFHTFLGENTQSFREVVFVEFPRDGCWSIGFVTGGGPDGAKALGKNMVYVFVPTTPNPTNGFLFMAPRESLRESKMTVEQGLKAVVSMGIASSETSATELE